MSFAEAAANVAVGYGVAVLTQILVFPLFGFHASLAENMALRSVFTVLCQAQHKAWCRSSAASRSGGCSRRSIFGVPSGEDGHTRDKGLSLLCCANRAAAAWLIFRRMHLGATMKHLIVIAAIVALLPFDVAISDRLSCDDPVDNEARIGFPGGLVVSVTEDASNKVCRFSVEGVSAGSPPQELIFEELRVLRGGLQNLGSANHVDLARTLPILLAAASPEETPDDDLLTDEFLANAQVCFSMVLQGAAKPFTVVENWDVDLSHLGFSCAYIRDGSGTWIESLNSYLGGSVRVEDLSGRKLILRNERDGLIEYLFVPLP